MKTITSLMTILAAACLLSGCGQPASNKTSFDEVVAQRRSIRKYDASKTISREMGFDTLIMGMRDSEKIAAELEIPENETKTT